MTGPAKEGMMSSRTRQRRWQDVDKGDILVTDLVRRYVMYQEDRNHSPKTVRWYSDMLGRFAESLESNARLHDVDVDNIRRYLRAARENGLSKFTLHAYARR
jgi:site-specific recombinase XerD